MSTSIAWCDETWNPVGGCEVARLEDGTVHPGCVNCYARAMVQRDLPGLAGYIPTRKWDGTIVEFRERWLKPLSLKKPTLYFYCSMADGWGDNVTDEARLILHGVMLLASRHTFLDLTKRPCEMARWLEAHSPEECLRALARYVAALGDYRTRDIANHTASRISCQWQNVPNIHRYVSCSDQRTVDELVPDLLRVPASRRGISLEPLVGEVTSLPAVDRVIVGCESGQSRRGCQLEWVHGVVRLCRDKALFMKQLDLNGRVSHDPAEWPEWARRREM